MLDDGRAQLGHVDAHEPHVHRGGLGPHLLRHLAIVRHVLVEAGHAPVTVAHLLNDLSLWETKPKEEKFVLFDEGFGGRQIIFWQRQSEILFCSFFFLSLPFFFLLIEDMRINSRYINSTRGCRPTSGEVYIPSSDGVYVP